MYEKIFIKNSQKQQPNAEMYYSTNPIFSNVFSFSSNSYLKYDYNFYFLAMSFSVCQNSL